MLDKKRTDKRTLKTTSAIKSALMSLMNKKPLDKITIVDLTSIADVNRVTFYLHYKDVNEVLESIKEEIEQGIADVINSVDVIGFQKNPYPYIYGILQLLYDNMGYTKFLFAPTTPTFFKQRLRQKIQDLIWENELLPRNFMTSVSISYIIAGVIAGLAEWIEDTSQTSLENLARILCDFITKGVLPIKQTN